MICIPDLTFTLKSEDHPVAPLDCELTITIKPTTSNQDVMSISYLCIAGEDTYIGNIDTDILEAMSTHLDLDIENEIWNTESLMDINLALQIDRLITTLTPEEINSVASPYTSIWNKEYPKTEEEMRQAFVDVFLAESGLYLTICDLLWTHNAWQIFPFSWELPFEDLDSSILSENAMNYMKLAISACAVISAGISRPISWLIESFCNSFSVDYIEGEELCTTALAMEVTTQVSKYNTAQASIQRQEMENYVNVQMSQIRLEYIEKQQYILQTLTEIHTEQASLVERIAALDMSSRLDTLEREVSDLSGIAQGSVCTEDNPSLLLELSADLQQLTERICVLESLVLN